MRRIGWLGPYLGDWVVVPQLDLLGRLLRGFFLADISAIVRGCRDSVPARGGEVWKVCEVVLRCPSCLLNQAFEGHALHTVASTAGASQHLSPRSPRPSASGIPTARRKAATNRRSPDCSLTCIHHPCTDILNGAGRECSWRHAACQSGGIY